MQVSAQCKFEKEQEGFTVNAWESVFVQSKANDGYYDEDSLLEFRWDWPKGTWFQARLDYIRERQPRPKLKCHRPELRDGQAMPAM